MHGNGGGCEANVVKESKKFVTFSINSQKVELSAIFRKFLLN